MLAITAGTDVTKSACVCVVTTNMAGTRKHKSALCNKIIAFQGYKSNFAFPKKLAEQLKLERIGISLQRLKQVNGTGMDILELRIMFDQTWLIHVAGNSQADSMKSKRL